MDRALAVATVPAMNLEINGDENLRLADRLRYLAANFRRNIAGSFVPVVARSWRPVRQSVAWRKLPTSTPSRCLTEAFLHQRLASLLTPGEVSVLDIGCGSGRTSGLLAAAGYRGQYTGVDLEDRFAAEQWAGDGFETQFIQGSAHDADVGGPFDLIVSVSALEHIDGDTGLIQGLDAKLAPTGLQVHFVPAPAALFVYLWHGYRQYGRAAIAARFGIAGTQVYRLGGLATFLLHLMVITIPEILLRISLRRRWPGLYKRLLAACLRADAWAPVLPVLHVVCRRRGGVEF